MFCRTCHYDVHAQLDPRCPECGTSFSPDDPTTYYAKRPTAWSWFRPNARIAAGVAIVLFATTLAVLTPTVTWCGGLRSAHGQVFSNLRHIINEADVELGRVANPSAFDMGDFVATSPQSFDPALDSVATEHRYRWQRFARAWVWTGMLVTVYMTAFVLFVWRRGRLLRRAAVTALVIAAMFSLACFGKGRRGADLIWHRDHRYLNDYIYVTGIDWSVGRRTCPDTIVAYSKHTFEGNQRILALMNGFIISIPEDEFQTMLAEQRAGHSCGTAQPGESARP